MSQSVPHAHVHAVPRRRGDGLRGFFWPRHPTRATRKRPRWLRSSRARCRVEGVRCTHEARATSRVRILTRVCSCKRASVHLRRCAKPFFPVAQMDRRLLHPGPCSSADSASPSIASLRARKRRGPSQASTWSRRHVAKCPAVLSRSSHRRNAKTSTRASIVSTETSWTNRRATDNLDLGEDVVRLREAVLGMLREDEALAVVHVEDPVRALDELGIEPLGLLDLGGQPDRVAFVASGRAVDDSDMGSTSDLAPPLRERNPTAS